MPVCPLNRRGSGLLRIDKLRAGALPPLSFEVADGECLAVEGPSGAGKTRLLRAIADLDPAPGQVFLDGVERNELTAAAWRKSVRFCAAEPAWWTPSVRPVLMPPEAGGRGKLDPKCERLLGQLGLNAKLASQPVASLSTGERMRFALARALIDEPKVLLLDEPTASLDPASGALVEELIKFLLLSGRIVLLVSHDARQIERLAHARLQLPGSPPQTEGKP